MAKRALGTTLSIGEDAPVTVAGLTSIGGLELSADTIDVTTLDSDGGYREFIGGFKDGGEVALEGYFDPATGKGQKELYDLFESGDTEAFVITFPAELGASWEFDGVVTAFGTGADLEDPLSFSCTIKVSGKPTLITIVDTTTLTAEPATVTFDKNTSGAGYVDVEIEVKHNTTGVTLTSVNNGETALTPTTHYTADGLVITILKTYLATLDEGAVTITFKTNKGDVDAVITIEDTTEEA
jgi:predicted secreted protein